MHQGRGGEAEEQYSWYAMYCGSKNPTAMQHPPTPTAAKRLSFGTDNPFRRLHAIVAASSANKVPLNSALLLNIVAHPNAIPAGTTNKSCLPEDTGPTGTLQVKNRNPTNAKNAAVLSPYGAERKIPAGEKMCRHPAIKANCGPDGPGKMAQASW